MSQKIYACNEYREMHPDDLPIMQANVEAMFEIILHELDFDWTKDPNMCETPKRIAKMYVQELFAGCYTPEPKFTVFPNTKKVDQIIYLKDVQVISTCSHHFMPFQGKCHIAYLPGEKICGVSKLARVVKWFMRRPQIQEELTVQIAEYINKKLSPKGVMVVIEAQHECMSCRGVGETGSTMGTSKVIGQFKTDKSLKQEFLSLLKG